MALTEAQKRAKKKWNSKNKPRVYYVRNRSSARNFIKKQATLEDIEELEKLIKDRKNELEK